MLARTLLRCSCKLPLMLFFLTFLGAVLLPQTANGQGLEMHGGWVHVTQDSGTDGFNAGGAWWFTRSFSFAGDYDAGWNNSTLSTFTFSQVGATAVRSHLQSWLFGPRYFFSTSWTDAHKLRPFVEGQIGGSHLNQQLKQVNLPTISESGTCFSWLLGGGAEYLFTPHWSARANLDLLRTHFANNGQSRFRFVLGVTYTLGER